MQSVRDRDMEAVKRRCMPGLVGSVLILAMNMAVMVKMMLDDYPVCSTRLGSVLTMAIASSLTLVMLGSMCARGNHTAAWTVVVLAPLIISMFTVQLDIILMR